MNEQTGGTNLVFDEDLYMKRLKELVRDCLREEYLAEILMPFFRMCCPENVKVIPVYDDRRSGPKTDNETEFKKRMETICALRDDGSYTVPDYIFVSKEYTVSNPIKPFFMVETKMPKILHDRNDGNCYQRLQHTLKKHEEELLTEIKSCGAVIYTDGITWMFLSSVKKDKKDEIVELDGYETICLVDLNLKKKYYETYESELRIDPQKWKTLKSTVYNFIVKKQSREK